MSVALSFVIPVYKKPATVIAKCLKTILEQSLTDFEIICVLDGPDDEAERTIKKALKSARVPCKLHTIEHGGACRARNAGASFAKGRYIVFFDADCYIEPHAAKMWVDTLDSDKKIDFLYSGYKFSGERGAIASEPFDPWTLRVTNYISGCFPIRREKAPKWDADLESLQDWSFWLSAIENGANGLFVEGYAFSTEYPDSESISGKGCTPEKWLERMDKVREKHNIPKRKVCVTSVNARHDGLALAKLIDADYLERPNDKPNHYETIVQVGFSLNPGVAEAHATAWGPSHKKILFWTKEDVEEVYNGVSKKALEEYSTRINQACHRQYVEDKASKDIMERCGFTTEVMPLPLVNEDPIAPLPEKPRFLIDAAGQYQHVISVLPRALPEFRFDVARGAQKLEDYTGLLHFFIDRTFSGSIKRMKVAGRHVISNVQVPFAGFLDDRVNDEKFIVSMVERLRKIAKQGPDERGAAYYKNVLDPKKLKEVLCA